MTSGAALSGGQRRGYVDCATGQVHYREQGEGHPLVILHQNPNSSAMYSAVHPLLASAGFRVIGFDHPGTGMSDPPPEPPLIGDYAGWLLEAAGNLGLEQFHLLGHHTGAAIATEMALAAPDRVQRLVLSGPPVLDVRDRDQVAIWARPRTIAPDGSHLLAAWQTRLAATPHWSDLAAMHRAVLWSLVAGDTFNWGFLAGMQYPMADRLPLLTCPTLLLTASHEDMYEPTLRAQQIRPDFDLIVFGDCTRDVPDERPQDWAAAVSDFLRAAAPV